MGICGADFYARAGLGAAQRDGQRRESVEPVAAGDEFLSAALAGYDGRRAGAGRPPGAAESVAGAVSRSGGDGNMGVWVCGEHDCVARGTLRAEGWTARASRQGVTARILKVRPLGI